MTKQDLIDKVLTPIEQAGGKAYFVGGCVRDGLLGKQPHDFDICTDFSPAQIRKVFKKFSNVSNNSEQFGVTMPLIDFDGKLEEIEIATFRKDETKGRHPKVSLEASIEEDAARRDFTINAMYEDSKGNIIDPTNLGMNDLQYNMLRFVGNPRDRLEEDPLRAFRFVRFMAQKGFDSAYEESEVQEFCRDLDFSGVSKERMLKEFIQILAGPYFNYKEKAFDMCFNTGVFDVVGLTDIFREMDEVEQAWRWHAEGSVFEKNGEKFIVDQRDMDLHGCIPMQHGTVLMHTFLTLDAMHEIIWGKDHKLQNLQESEDYNKLAINFIGNEKGRFLLTLGALLHDIGKAHCQHQGTREKSFEFEGKTYTGDIPVVNEHPQTGIPFAEAFCKGLKMSNEDTHFICSVVAHHMDAHSLHKFSEDHIWKFVTHPHFKEIMLVALADERGGVKLEGFDERGSVKEILNDPKVLDILSRGPLPEPILKGNDLIEKGYKPSPKFKKALEAAYKTQINGKISDKKTLFRTIKNLLK